MAQFTVRSIEEDVKARLKQRAVRNGTSLEAEVRDRVRERDQFGFYHYLRRTCVQYFNRLLNSFQVGQRSAHH